MSESLTVLKQLATDGLLQPLVTGAIGVAVAGIALVTILTNRWSTRMKATLDLLERLETTEYYQIRYRAFRKIRREAGGIERIMAMSATAATVNAPSERDLCLEYLNQYEFIALGVEKRILDEAFFRNTYGPIVTREWHAARKLIFSLRDENPDYYRAFTRLVKRWDPSARWPSASTLAPLTAPP